MKGIVLASFLVASVAAQNMNALPTCSRFCLESMINKAEELDCNAGDWSCLCSNTDFWYGVRDCTNQACDGLGLAAANEAAAGMCPSKSIVTSSSSPDTFETSSTTAGGASRVPSASFAGSSSPTAATRHSNVYQATTPASSIGNRKMNAATVTSSIFPIPSAYVATTKPSTATAGTAATAFEASITADSSAFESSDDIVSPKSTKNPSSSHSSKPSSKTSAVFDLQSAANPKSNAAARPTNIPGGVIAALCLLGFLVV